MNKKLTILIVASIGLLIVATTLIVGSYVSVAPEPVNQQKGKIEQEPVNSEVAKGKTCEDSDGLDYYTKGELTVCDFETYEEPGVTSPIGCALHHDLCGSEPNIYGKSIVMETSINLKNMNAQMDVRKALVSNNFFITSHNSV